MRELRARLREVLVPRNLRRSVNYHKYSIYATIMEDCIFKNESQEGRQDSLKQGEFRWKIGLKTPFSQ